MKAKNNSLLYVSLVVLYATSLIVSNIIAGKLWQAPLGLIFTTGVWLFPIVYIIGDVIPEVYGMKKAQQAIWLGFAANLFAVLFFYLCLRLPAPVFWENQGAFEVVLGFTPRLLLASFCGFLVGSNANAAVMVAMKRITGPKKLWSRTITSTVVGESLDTLVFASIAFYGLMPTSALTTLILSMAAFKIIYEIVATPLTYIMVNAAKRVEGVDQEVQNG